MFKKLCSLLTDGRAELAFPGHINVLFFFKCFNATLKTQCCLLTYDNLKFTHIQMHLLNCKSSSSFYVVYSKRENNSPCSHRKWHPLAGKTPYKGSKLGSKHIKVVSKHCLKGMPSAKTLNCFWRNFLCILQQTSPDLP